MEEVKKPLNHPQGWQLKTKYVDSNGDVYCKGKFTGETIAPPNVVGTNEEKELVSKIQETPENPPVEKKSKTEVKEKEVETKTSDYSELQRKVEQQQELINKLLLNQGQPQQSKEPLRIGFNHTKDIPQEDYQNKKKTYITRGRGFLLGVYEKDGKYYYSPYDLPPVFEYYYTDQNRRGKDVDILHFSLFSTHSKKEMEYIENSPYYNVTIFSEVDKAIKYSSEMYNKMQNLTQWTARLEGEKLFNTASSLGIAITGKTKEELKMEIIAQRLSQLQQQENKVQESRVARLAEREIFDTSK